MSEPAVDPRKVYSQSDFQLKLKLAEHRLYLPKRMSLKELEWEYWVSKLHWGYLRATDEDLETIKEIASRM